MGTFFSDVWDPIRTPLILFLTVPVIAFIASFRKFFRSKAIQVADALQYSLDRWINFTISASASMRTYCRIALARPDTASLRVPGDDREIPTDGMFVRLNLESTDQAAYTSIDVLDAGHRLRVIGDPGSGKTSLVKRIFRDSCRKAIASPKTQPLPLIIELKTLRPPASDVSDEEIEEWIWRVCKDKVEPVHGYKMDALFEQYSKSSDSGLLVLLDGLDEVAADRYPAVRRALNLLSRRLSDRSAANRVVLTMRVQFHQQSRQDFADQYPSVLAVRPFSTGDIYDFLVRWFTTLPSKTVTAANVHAELAEKPSLRDLCRNPLVLAMYVSNFLKVRGQNLPDTRTQFYQEVTKELLIRRRSEQLGDRRAQVVALRQRQAIFGILALENMVDPAQATNSLSWARALEVVAEVTGVEADDADEAFTTLGSETGLTAVERDGESFRFLHRSFCEFFAALEAARGERSDAWRGVIDARRALAADSTRRADSRLDDTVAFMVGLLPNREQQRAALTAVAEIGHDPLLGRCLLETQAYDHDIWPQYFTHERTFLLSVESTAWDDSWLRRLHLYQTVVADATNAETMNVRPRQALDGDDLFTMFSTLVGDSRDRLNTLFSRYAGEGASAAFRLARGVGVDLVTESPGLIVNAMHEDAPFLDFAIEQAGADSTDARAWARIIAEAALESRYLAVTLNKVPCPSRWLDELALMPRSARLDRDFPKSAHRPSIYAAAMSLAMHGTAGKHERVATDAVESKFPLVDALSLVPAPAVGMHMWPGLALAGIGFAGFVALAGAPLSANQAGALSIAVTLLLLFSIVVAVRPVARRTHYRMLLLLRKYFSLDVTTMLLTYPYMAMRVSLTLFDRKFLRASDALIKLHDQGGNALSTRFMSLRPGPTRLAD